MIFVCQFINSGYVWHLPFFGQFSWVLGQERRKKQSKNVTNQASHPSEDRKPIRSNQNPGKADAG